MNGGEPHQRSATPLTSNQGTPISDDQNTVVAAAKPLLEAAGVKTDGGVIDLAKGVDGFITAAKRGRIWAREDLAQVPPPAKKRKK